MKFGRYELGRQIASGSRADLFVATSSGDHGFTRKLAIKRLHPHLDANEAAIFVDEAAVNARLSHPKIVHTYELGNVDGVLYVAREHVDGIDLQAMLRELAEQGQRMEPQLAAWLAHEIADALDHAHRLADERGVATPILHRDVAPANVLLSVRGDVKLANFRTARPRANGYGYMSPEQLAEQPLNARSDLFVIGTVLAEMLMGRRLFAASTELDTIMLVRDARVDAFATYATDVPPALAAIVRTALDRRPAARWPDAAALRDALADWLFEARHRVTSAHVAAVVTSVRRAAESRRAAAKPIGQLARGSERSEPIRLATVAIPPLRQPAASSDAPPATARRVPTSSAPPDSLVPLLTRERVTSGLTPPFGLSISAAAPAATVDARGGATQAARAEPAPVAVRPAESMEEAFEQMIVEPAPAAPAPRPPVMTDIESPADESGDLAVQSPLRVLFRLAVSRASGLLVVTVGAIKKEIYFRDGSPEFVSSNVGAELFGQFLAANGVLSSGELAMALAMLPRYRGKLGDALVGLGLLKPLEVFRHLTRQVRAKLVDVCTWTRGSYAWFTDRANPYDTFRLDLNPYEVLGVGAMAMGESAVQAWATEHAASRPRISPARPVSAHRFMVNGLPEVLATFDGRTLDELARARESRDERIALYRMVRLLHACELVVFT